MTDYVSPFQPVGHDGECHDMCTTAGEDHAKQAVMSQIHVVASEGDGTPMVTGELGPLPMHLGKDGKHFVRVEDVYAGLASLLRSMADDLDALNADEQNLDEQA